MTVTSKVRLYDLAKELKQDTKRIIEEVRREGVDVSVPSNSISKELADKIRNRYFPKKEQSAPRKVVVVKRARPVVAEEAPAAEAAEAAPAPQPQPASEPARPATPVEHPAGKPPVVVRQVRKLTPAARAEHPAAAAPAQEQPLQETEPPAPGQAELSLAQEAAAPATEERTTAAPPAGPAPAPAPSRQIRVLRPTAEALNAGVRIGERAPAPAAPPQPVSPRERRERQERPDRSERGQRPSLSRAERSGTPGETATPQITYIPSPTDGRGRARGRSGRHST
ncbi:MAG: translation initiation factor IF-2 N-terminal domain-containing protein, partial [Acidobacteria bacterium]|nr:translation initiation factor IF-2 N-terminal domain-containing protein [Acidobacteriota bacterium]